MDLLLIIFGLVLIYTVIILAINNSKLTKQIELNNALSKVNNTILKDIRNLMKENREEQSANKKTSGHVIDKKL